MFYWLFHKLVNRKKSYQSSNGPYETHTESQVALPLQWYSLVWRTLATTFLFTSRSTQSLTSCHIRWGYLSLGRGWGQHPTNLWELCPPSTQYTQGPRTMLGPFPPTIIEFSPALLFFSLISMVISSSVGFSSRSSLLFHSASMEFKLD